MTVSWPLPPAPIVSRDDAQAPALERRVKVLHIVTKFEAGAGGNTLVSATGMNPDRYEVWIAGAAGGPLWSKARSAGLHTVPIASFKRELSPLSDLRVLIRLVRLIRQERFTIVHTHNAKGGFLGRLAARLCHTPIIVYSLHGKDPWWRTGRDDAHLEALMGPLKRRAYLALERLQRDSTHRFVAVAPEVARAAVELRIATPGLVDVAPSAVEMDRIPDGPDPSVRTDLAIPPGPLVGTVGRLDEQKAPLDFVRMAREVALKRPDARFVWVGDGDLEHEARREAARLGVEITFTGFRDDAPRIAASFDVYVVSSLYEGIGRGLTEAMAAGRPVVATAVDGIPDVVAPGATGLLAPPGDPRALAERVCWMLDHPDEAVRMGSAAKRYVRSLFDPEVMCSVLDAVYSQLLGLPPLPAPGNLAAADLASFARLDASPLDPATSIPRG